MKKTILVTGGAGFIGSNFILRRIKVGSVHVVNLDKLTYAGNLRNLESIGGDLHKEDRRKEDPGKENPRYEFVHGDIGDRGLVRRLLEKHQPQAIVHFAAESHVDRSIRGPEDFIRTNIDGTFALLEETRAHWTALPEGQRAQFRFL